MTAPQPCPECATPVPPTRRRLTPTGPLVSPVPYGSILFCSVPCRDQFVASAGRS